MIGISPMNRATTRTMYSVIPWPIWLRVLRVGDGRCIGAPLNPAVDHAHREFTPEQIEFLANIVRLYRGRESETTQGSAELMAEHFPDGAYRDVAGLCKVATLDEIEAQGWSLNPGRYVGVAEREEDDFDFAERLTELHEELEVLNAEAHKLEERIAENVTQMLDSLQPLE